MATAQAESSSARILANSGFRAIADIGGKLATAALFIVLAREVGAGEYGIWTFAFSFTILLTIPGSIGQDVVLTREVARDPARLDEVLSDALVSRIAITLPVMALALLAGLAWGMDTGTWIVVLLLGAGATMDALLHIVFAVFQAFERAAAVPVILIAQRWSTTIGALVALYLGAGVAAVAAIYAACGFAALVLGFVLIFRLLARPRLRISWAGWTGLVRASAPIGIASVAYYVLLRVDTIMLALFQPAEDVGQYGAAFRLLETTLFVTWSVNAAVLPTLCRLTPHTERPVGAVYARAMKLVLAITVPIGVGAVVLAEPIVVTLYGEQYRPAATALVLLAPAIVLYPVSMLSTSLLYSQGRARLAAYAYLAILVQNVLLNLWLIPRWSFDGAAAGTSISELLVAATLLVACVPLHGNPDVRRILAGTVVAASVAAATMWLLRDPLVVAVAAAVPAYLVVLLAVERRAYPADFAALASLAQRIRDRRATAPRGGGATPRPPHPPGPEARATRG